MKQEEIRKAVRDRYGHIAAQEGLCCFPTVSCCGRGNAVEDISRAVGYLQEDLQAAPEGSNLGLGCGNPVALASLREGETVVDLGSCAGFDCFLAAGRVGESGRVIGVDMTPEMIDKARENARKSNFENVEFRLGEIENLPVADRCADVVLSNCVINLSPNKGRVFQEAFRVLKPGGRLMVSDICLLKDLPAAVIDSIEAYVQCVAGAVRKDDYIGAIEAAGFAEIRVLDETLFPMEMIVGPGTMPGRSSGGNAARDLAEGVSASIASVKIAAVKPDEPGKSR